MCVWCNTKKQTLVQSKIYSTAYSMYNIIIGVVLVYYNKLSVPMTVNDI